MREGRGNDDRGTWAENADTGKPTGRRTCLSYIQFLIHELGYPLLFILTNFPCYECRNCGNDWILCVFVVQIVTSRKWL